MPRRRVLISAQPPVPPPLREPRCPSPPPILSDHLTQTHTHTNMHTNIYIHTCITVIVLFPGFFGGLCFLNGPSDIFHTHHPALVQRRRSTAVTLALAHVLRLYKPIVFLMILYTKQLSPGGTALVARSFWHQPATLMSFNIQNKFLAIALVMRQPLTFYVLSKLNLKCANRRVFMLDHWHLCSDYTKLLFS